MDAEKKLADKMGVSYKINQCLIDGFNINYLVAGEGEPLLLIHGANIGWGMWYLNIPELSKKYKVIALDLPGAGVSDSLDFKNIDLEKIFVQLIENFLHFLEVDNIRVVGHSFGGWIAMKLAIVSKINIKKIVLSDSLGFSTSIPASQWPATVGALAKFISKTFFRATRSNMDRFLSSAFYSKTSVSELFYQYYFESLLGSDMRHPLLFFNGLSSFLRMRKELDLRSSLSLIKQPVLVVWGSEDKNVVYKNSKDFFKLIPNHKVEIIKEAGHVPSLEKSNLFNSLVLNFFQD
ncbi:MAG: alpha/beta hydrolase [Candidatus Magasanikbacteria bacterium]|nr:alpha/beta hydrolase [Candidatus Magasanikbacteria bacterium]